MQNAPSVVYPVGRCVFYGLLLATLAALSGAVGFFFFAGVVPQTDRHWGWLASASAAVWWLGWVAVAAVTWLRTPEGALKWDASAPNEGARAGAWFWCSAPGIDPMPLSGVECALDLQSIVLLRCRSASPVPRWIWAERRSQSARWSELRRALVSSRG